LGATVLLVTAFFGAGAGVVTLEVVGFTTFGAAGFTTTVATFGAEGTETVVTTFGAAGTGAAATTAGDGFVDGGEAATTRGELPTAGKT
jgi:hypothetical protein